MSLLDGDLAADIAEAMDDVAQGCIITRMLPGDGPPHNPGDPVPDPHACKGYVDDYDLDQIDGTLIQENDRKVVILAASIDIVPKPQMTVTIRGATYTVLRVSADPALATYTLQARA